MNVSTVIHYLLPSGERVSEEVSALRYGDHCVEWVADGVTRKTPWNRVLMIDETHVLSEAEIEEFVTVMDDMGVRP